ncbi:DUF5988 family protein [Actinocrispum sp. NPDC049592]|uniref:DUF5988 family protein n=1 Tax=Actinocrispum sp. NPDC049592 TaxID=3154835 RepID=UPI0034249CB5
MVTATKAVLAGGPAEVTEGPVVTGLDDKVKVPFASGYEHFAHNGEFLMVEGESRPVFRWCGRTKIAE